MTTLVLTRDNGQRFVVGGPTQLGKSTLEDRNIWAVPSRVKPDLFKDLEVLVRIEDCEYISRNHAAIYRQGEEYFILDLNSCNGTAINGVNINPDPNNQQPRQLHEHDVISLANMITFAVSFRETTKYALLVGAGEDHAGAMYTTVTALQQQLRRRSFEVHYLLGEDASKQGIKDKLEEFRYLTVNDSQFFFAYHGHGSRHGLTAAGQTINPRELYERIARLKGEKIVFIDACNAGLFVDQQLIPPETLVMASCGVNRTAFETRLVGDDTAYIGRFSRALVGYLESHPEDLKWMDFYHAINGTTHLNLAMQEQMMAGKEMTVPDMVRELMTIDFVRNR